MFPLSVNKSDAIFCQGYSGSAVGIRGSFRGFFGAMWTLFTSFSIWPENPGHQTELLARMRHLSMPWCPLWSLVSVSCCIAAGTTIRVPCNRRSPWRVRFPRASQYGATASIILVFPGHSVRQYLITSEQRGSVFALVGIVVGDLGSMVAGQHCCLPQALLAPLVFVHQWRASGLVTECLLCTGVYQVHVQLSSRIDPGVI